VTEVVAGVEVDGDADSPEPLLSPPPPPHPATSPSANTTIDDLIATFINSPLQVIVLLYRSITRPS
jgi:hypothetical protein